MAEEQTLVVEELAGSEPELGLCTGSNCCFASTELDLELVEGVDEEVPVAGRG